MKIILTAIIICLANNTGFCKINSMRILPAKDTLSQNKINSKIKINSFEAIVKGSTVTCVWLIAPEIRNNYFELERSFDGVNFKVVALAFGIEESSNTNIKYKFKDNNEALKLNDIVYYRLRHIGDDSVVENCKLIKISLLQSASNALGVVPNPFATNFTYEFIAPSTGYIITKIKNLGGRLISTKHMAVTKGYNNLAIDDFTGFCSGAYIIEVIMNGSIIGRQKINKV